MPGRSVIAALGLACGLALGAGERDFPLRPVHLVVPFAAGGTGGQVACAAGAKLAEYWGQPVIVENRSGGNTIVAAEQVWRAAPDGYTLLVALDATLTMNPSLYPALPYRAAGFAPVTLLVEQPLLLTAGPKRPEVTRFEEFVREARSHPGARDLGIGAIVTRIAAEQIRSAAGIDLTLVPFQGGSQTLKAMLGGQIDFALSDIGLYTAALREGRLRGLAVTGPRRSPAEPAIPTLAEAGLPGVSMTSWFGVVAPPGTSPERVAQLNADFRRALEDPEVKERLLRLGLEASPTTPSAFAGRIRDETERWDRVIRSAGIRIE